MKQIDIMTMEEDRAYAKVKELIDMVEPYNIDPDIIDKINAIGCTSFKYELAKDDDYVYVLPVGDDKQIKIAWRKEQ